MHGNDRLTDDRSAVELGANEMHCAAGEADTRRERLPLSMQTAERRQQGRMDVDHPITPGLDKTLLQHPHETSKADELDALPTERRFGLCREVRPIAMRDDDRGNAGRGGEIE